MPLQLLFSINILFSHSWIYCTNFYSLGLCQLSLLFHYMRNWKRCISSLLPEFLQNLIRTTHNRCLILSFRIHVRLVQLSQDITIPFEKRMSSPDTVSRLIMLFMSCVLMIISSNTGTLPPTRPVLPPWGVMARFLSEQYLTIAETSSVVLGLSKTRLFPTAKEKEKISFWLDYCVQKEKK